MSYLVLVPRIWMHPHCSVTRPPHCVTYTPRNKFFIAPSIVQAHHYSISTAQANFWPQLAGDGCRVKPGEGRGRSVGDRETWGKCWSGGDRWHRLTATTSKHPTPDRSASDQPAEITLVHLRVCLAQLKR